MIIYVTSHEENSVYVHMKFNNFLSKYSVSMKLLLVAQLTKGNPIQFTERV